MSRVRIGLAVCTIAVMLTACAPSTPRVAAPKPASAPVLPDSSAATWTAEPGLLASSTVDKPGLPSFPLGSIFVVDNRGSGKAVARFMAPGPSPEPWHRVARFTVDQTIVDGVWVESLTLSGRLSDDTVVTTKEQVAFGSDEFVTVSRPVRDIMHDDPEWHGFDDNTLVSITFKRKGNSPLDVRTITVLDPTFRSVSISDFGPAYDLRSATDPIIRNALLESEGATASIVAYLVDFKPPSRPGSALELFVGKTGGLFRPIGRMTRPQSAFGQVAGPRSGPESDREAAARRAAVSAGEAGVATSLPQFVGCRGEVWAYLVRVWHADGSHVDVLVDSNSAVQQGSRVSNLQPWPLPSK